MAGVFFSQPSKGLLLLDTGAIGIGKLMGSYTYKPYVGNKNQHPGHVYMNNRQNQPQKAARKLLQEISSASISGFVTAVKARSHLIFMPQSKKA
ncbi:hypothetical protein BP5796_11941 [Coleophoma crateriformis]|uniref:Uncharacterized protein n=1 Tax=Coleophoma crateriformis TaxID=565419 RepID=A0A3D8QBD4_9HELO|nr:hypothetical protein BP5796_11941 [Coleophoma crateriformis]